MKNNEKLISREKKAAGSITLYIAGSVVALIAIASLVNNIRLYTNNVSSYVAQGYPAVDVAKQLIPSFLLPGVFEAIAVYGGIAFLLFFAGLIYQKIHQCLAILTPDSDGVIEENVVGDEEDIAHDNIIPEDNQEI